MNKIISNEKNNKKLLTKQMNSTIIIKRLERGAKKYRGVEQSVARRAHNPEVVGSSPSPATTSGVLTAFEKLKEHPLSLC